MTGVDTMMFGSDDPHARFAHPEAAMTTTVYPSALPYPFAKAARAGLMLDAGIETESLVHKPLAA